MKRIVISALLALTGASTWALDYTPSRYQHWTTSVASATTPLFINPGNITDADQIEVMAGIYSTVNNQAGLNYVSAVVPFGLKHTFRYVCVHQRCSVDNAPAGQNGSFRKDAIFLGYGYRLFHWMTLGANVSVINLNNFGATQSTPIGMDFGVLFNPIQDSKVGFLKVGAVVQNAVLINNDNTTNLNLGALDGLQPLDRGPHGIQHDRRDPQGRRQRQDRDGLCCRCRLLHYPNVALGLKQTREGFPMLTFAGNAKRLSYLRYLEVELDVTHDGISPNDQKRGLLWNVKATTRFGPTREEREGAGRYARLIREPSCVPGSHDLVRQARLLGCRIRVRQGDRPLPDLPQGRRCHVLPGTCFREPSHERRAKKIYASGVKVHDASDYVPKFYYQQLNVAYKEGNLAEAQKNYNIIVTQYAQSDVRGDADYVMGQGLLAAGQNTEARKLLENVRQDDPNYGYAHYTLGLIATKEGNPEAQQHFEYILSKQGRNKSEKESAGSQPSSRPRALHCLAAHPRRGTVQADPGRQ